MSCHVMETEIHPAFRSPSLSLHSPLKPSPPKAPWPVPGGREKVAPIGALFSHCISWSMLWMPLYVGISCPAQNPCKGWAGQEREERGARDGRVRHISTLDSCGPGHQSCTCECAFYVCVRACWGWALGAAAVCVWLPNKSSGFASNATTNAGYKRISAPVRL